MEHRKNKSHLQGVCLIFCICLSRLGAVFASSGENWNGRAVNAKRLESKNDDEKPTKINDDDEEKSLAHP